MNFLEHKKWLRTHGYTDLRNVGYYFYNIEEQSSESNEENGEVLIVDENYIKNRIYMVRGQKVMLDYELAEIYGYTTTRFNEQVKNNIEKFPKRYSFQLSCCFNIFYLLRYLWYCWNIVYCI